MKVKKTGTVTIKREGAKKNGRPMKDRMEIDNGKLYPFVKYNAENKKYECAFCEYNITARVYVFRHLKTDHQNEIKQKVDDQKIPQLGQKYSCDDKMCKKLYGYKNRHFWCTVCTMKKKPKKNPQIKKEKKLCPDCGKGDKFERTLQNNA